MEHETQELAHKRALSETPTMISLHLNNSPGSMPSEEQRAALGSWFNRSWEFSVCHTEYQQDLYGFGMDCMGTGGSGLPLSNMSGVLLEVVA